MNGVKYQSHDEFWRVGELMFEEIDVDETSDLPGHLELLPIVDWDLPSPVTPRLGTPRDGASIDEMPREVGTPHSLYINVSTPSPREEPGGFWDTIAKMSLEEMVSYVTGQ